MRLWCTRKTSHVKRIKHALVRRALPFRKRLQTCARGEFTSFPISGVSQKCAFGKHTSFPSREVSQACSFGKHISAGECKDLCLRMNSTRCVDSRIRQRHSLSWILGRMMREAHWQEANTLHHFAALWKTGNYHSSQGHDPTFLLHVWIAPKSDNRARSL